MTRVSSPNPRFTAFIAALATFTALVWIGVVTRAVLLRKIRETPVAEAPAHPQSQPMRAARTDDARGATSSPAPVPAAVGRYSSERGAGERR